MMLSSFTIHIDSGPYGGAVETCESDRIFFGPLRRSDIRLRDDQTVFLNQAKI